MEDNNGQNDVAQKTKRREAHTQAEKRRRDSINRGYLELQRVVPTVQSETDPNSGQKISKFQILLRSIDYLEFLKQQNDAQDAELTRLKKEYAGLNLMKSSYERLSGETANQQINSGGPTQVRNQEHQNEIKLQFFKMLGDQLFTSFDEQVSCDDIAALFNTVVPWLEYECNPSRINEIVKQLLEQIESENRTT
jgi:hypothetical protein